VHCHRQYRANPYPGLARHGLSAFSSADILRFLGAKVPNGHFEGDLTTDFKHRAEGIRIKHFSQGNSVKMYDKQGSVLRVETTIGNPRAYKVWRRAAGSNRKKWRPMRKGISDLYRLTKACQGCNQRYFALALRKEKWRYGQIGGSGVISA
jgi:hypothetical protein